MYACERMNGEIVHRKTRSKEIRCQDRVVTVVEVAHRAVSLVLQAHYEVTRATATDEGVFTRANRCS